ncbi:MAG: hypothetical protein ACJ0HV_00420 [Candidatus Pseudothioglobus sp.]
MAIISTAFIWMVSLAEAIILSVMSFFAVILMFWTFTMAGILADENGHHLFCESSDTGIEHCQMREWSIVS